MTTKVCTCWYKAVEGGFKFSHLTDGFDPTLNEPIPTSPAHAKSCKGLLWAPIKARLVDGDLILDETAEKQLRLLVIVD